MKLGMGMSLDDLIALAGAGGVVGSTLLQDLVSYWPLNEQSGTRYDAVGSNDLTDNNTVGAVNRGPVGTVASFVKANSESLSYSGEVLAGDSDYSFSGWYKLSSDTAGYHFLAQAYTTAYGDAPLLLQWNVAAGLQLVGWVGASPELLITDSGFAFDGKWHFIAVTHDVSAKTGELFVDGVSKGTDTYAGDLTASTTNFRVGGEIGLYLDATAANCGVWSGVLSGSAITSLFNSGNGKSYADLTAAEKVDLVSYWNLDEVSGQRYDSHGTNHLTDNNTVGSVNSGPKGTVASFVVANNEYLSQSGAFAAADASLTVVAWEREGTAGTSAIFSSGADDGNFLFRMLAGVNLELYTRGFADHVVTSSPVPLDAAKGWQMIHAYHDATANKIGVGADGVTFLTADTGGTNGALSNIVVGARDAAQNHFDGSLGPVGVWTRKLTDVELVALFASGNGKKYADLTTAEKVGLVSYWNLDEQSGTRVDSHGSNDLTDNNTVGSVVNAGDAMDGAAATFVAANSESLSRAVSQSGPYSFSFWTKGDPAVNQTCIQLAAGTRASIRSSGNVEWAHAGYGANAANPAASADDWLFVYVDWDGTHAHISVNNGSLTAVAVADPSGSTAMSFGGTTWYHNGSMDEVALWSRVLTADERTALYNSGAGKFYPFA